MEIVLIAMVTAAAWTDLRNRRIPNWIPVSGAVLGLVLHAWSGGFYGAMTSLAGAALGLGIFIALYIAGGMGAGDVKLFSAVGALVGPQALIIVFIWTGLLGGVAALALSMFRGRLRETLGKTRALALGINTAPAADSLRLPYGAVIAGGALLSLMVSWLRTT
ncbi:MAG: prepilin peptidase [Bryobacterales bacterium]|nr:prepilin peptidase [Bryobacterales bacterium]